MIGNRIKTTFFLGLLSGLIIGIGALLGSRTTIIIAFIIAMTINFVSYFFSDKIVLAMYKAKEVEKNHRLYRIVEELSYKAKIPMPKVYTIIAPSPNAFATGRNYKHSAVAATESLLSLLTEEEIKGVMAHELSHIKHRDTLIQTIAVGIASAISMIASMMQWALIFGFGGGDEGEGIGSLVGMLAIIILTPIIATVIQLAISRSREYMADEGAANIMKTPQPLISALQKLDSFAEGKLDLDNTKSATASLFIVNPFRGSSLLKLFSTHPATEDRVKKLRELKLHR